MTSDTFVLGVDLDGVCGNYTAAFRNVVAAETGCDPEVLRDQTSWEFAECWSAAIRDRDHYLELHKRAVLEHRIFATMPEIPGASDSLWRLSDAGVHIRVITHRLCVNWGHDIAVTDTVAWLQAPRPDGRPRIPYRDLCFTGAKTEVDCDMLVDDSPSNVLKARSARTSAVVFDSPYNQFVPGARAHTWDEVEALVTTARSERALFEL